MRNKQIYNPTYRYTMRPKPTVYNSVRYASRLEARWARFFDAMGFKFRYEPFGPDSFPDFKVAGFGADVSYFEVKNENYNSKDLVDRLQHARSKHGRPVTLLAGEPDFRSYIQFGPYRFCRKCGIAHLTVEDCYLCGSETTYPGWSFQVAFCNNTTDDFSCFGSMTPFSAGKQILPPVFLPESHFHQKYINAVRSAKTYDYDAEF